MSTETIEKPAAAPAAAAPAVEKPAAAPAATEKPAAAAPAATPAEKPAAKPAATAKPAGNFLDDVEDDDNEEAPADETPAGKEGDEAPAAKPAAWREDWREALAGGDEKLLKELKRYKDIDGWNKSVRALRQKMSSGDLKRAKPPEDATPAEIAEWRKDNGIPDAPTEYELPKHDWSEADKPLVDSFLAKLHSANTPAPIAKAAVEWYTEFQAQQIEARTVADREQAIENEEKYRTEWGGDYRANISILKRALKDPELMPDGLGAAMADARMPDGTLLRNHPAFFQAFANLAKEKYGEAAMLPQDTVNHLNNREAELVKLMNENYDDYMHKKGPSGKTGSDELMEIRRAKEGHGKRR